MINLEELKENSKNKCCLDFNTTIGVNLNDKMQSLYIVLSRMQSIAKRDALLDLDVLITSPLVLALFEATDHFSPAGVKKPINNVEVSHKGSVFKGKWELYVDEKTYQEHHIIMCCRDGEGISEDPAKCVKVSITNFLMSNLFGYFNMS